MKITSIKLRKIETANLIEYLIGGNFQVPSNNEKKYIQKEIVNSIQDGKYNLARNALTLGLHFDNEVTLKNIKKKGLFRYSNYITKKCIVNNLALDVLQISKDIGCHSGSLNSYFLSIINLYPIHAHYNALYKTILLEMKKFERKYKGKSLVKTLLVYIDYLFLSYSGNKAEFDLNKHNNRLAKSKEELSTAASYIIYIYTDKFKMKKEEGFFVAEKFINSNEINYILDQSCLIIDIKEFEIMIDCFEYRCIKEGTQLRIIHPYVDFEKSIRLGYIKSELQRHNDSNRFKAENVVSLEYAANEIKKLKKFDFFKFTNSKGYPRYRLEIPEPIYELIVDNLIKPDSLFKEEVEYLSHIFKEQLLDFTKLKNVQVTDNLNLFEFIKIKRLFSIFYIFYNKEIYELEKSNSDLLLRSLIPAFSKKDFYSLMEKVAAKSMIESFVDLICWGPKKEVLFDLQYHSILFINNHFLIPQSVLVNSNSIRNLFASEYKRNNKNLISDGVIDPLVNALNDSFNNVNINSYTETQINNSDLDLFAVYESTLFVFECKHTLHPINIFDLRTTYDYIKKAEKQLDNINDQFLNGILISYLESKHDIDLSRIKNIESCIILSNRLFNGNVFRYPVRYINEVDSFLSSGVLETKDGKFCLWKTDKLMLSDLLEYFSLNSKLVKLGFSTLTKHKKTYPLKRIKIKFDTYYMDLDNASQKVKSFTSKLTKLTD